jgi:hypothetical protein
MFWIAKGLMQMTPMLIYLVCGILASKSTCIVKLWEYGQLLNFDIFITTFNQNVVYIKFEKNSQSKFCGFCKFLGFKILSSSWDESRTV